MTLYKLLAVFLSAALSLSSGVQTLPVPGEVPVQPAAADFTTEDVVTYVDGIIKENYLGQFDPDYMALVGIDEAEAQQVYEDSIDTEVEWLCYYFDVTSPTDEFRQELREICKEIYRHTKYEILDATRLNDGSFAVSLSVEPIDAILRIEQTADEALAPFFEKYPSAVIEAMSDEEFEALDHEWAELITELFRRVLPDMGNLPAKSLTLRVEPDEDGIFFLTNDSFALLDDTILSYGAG